MIIEEPDFRLTPVSDSSELFDLEFLYTVNKGKENERTEFRNAAYGISLESAIKRITQHRIITKFDGESIGLAAYLDAYKKIIEEIKALCGN